MSKISLEQKVERILTDYPQTRNSDVELTIKIWEVYHGVGDSVKTRDIFSLPREDNVKRIRARIQNDQHRLLPTSEQVAKQRKWNIQVWRERLGYNPIQLQTAKIVKEKVAEQKAIRWLDD